MRAWRDEAIKMRSQGATYQQIAAKFGVSAYIARYETHPRTRELAKARIEKQRKNGSRREIEARYHKKCAQRALVAAREYGCGDAV